MAGLANASLAVSLKLVSHDTHFLTQGAIQAAVAMVISYAYFSSQG